MMLLDYDEETMKGFGVPVPFHWRDLHEMYRMHNVPCESHPKIVKFYLYVIEALHHGHSVKLPKNPVQHCPQDLRMALTWALISPGHSYRAKLNDASWQWLKNDPPRFERRLLAGQEKGWLRRKFNI